ncbi:MAG: toluene tolerance protein [Nitrosomonadales bacterium]|nr:toluene tolerance protein [Nitrosomonadales bacterium]
MRKSQYLSQEQFETLSQGASILESDERGIKVLRLSNGDILKIFRVRNKCSIARIYSYARRFCRNADRLEKLGIPTVDVKQLYHLEAARETAVLYAPLQGHTLRELMAARSLSAKEAKRIGVFIARLHRSGIHFRSLHLGNIVLSPDGELGLIDIADMSIYPWPLWCNTRARSFSHLHRYPAQIEQLGLDVWQSIQDGYFGEAKLNRYCTVRLHQHLQKISVFV